MAGAASVETELSAVLSSIWRSSEWLTEIRDEIADLGDDRVSPGRGEHPSSASISATVAQLEQQVMEYRTRLREELLRTRQGMPSQARTHVANAMDSLHKGLTEMAAWQSNLQWLFDLSGDALATLTEVPQPVLEQLAQQALELLLGAGAAPSADAAGRQISLALTLVERLQANWKVDREICASFAAAQLQMQDAIVRCCGHGIQEALLAEKASCRENLEPRLRAVLADSENKERLPRLLGAAYQVYRRAVEAVQARSQTLRIRAWEGGRWGIHARAEPRALAVLKVESAGLFGGHLKPGDQIIRVGAVRGHGVRLALALRCEVGEVLEVEVLGGSCKKRKPKTDHGYQPLWSFDESNESSDEALSPVTPTHSRGETSISVPSSRSRPAACRRLLTVHVPVKKTFIEYKATLLSPRAATCPDIEQPQLEKQSFTKLLKPLLADVSNRSCVGEWLEKLLDRCAAKGCKLPDYDGASGIRVMTAMLRQCPECCAADVVGKWLDILWAKQENKSPAPELVKDARLLVKIIGAVTRQQLSLNESGAKQCIAVLATLSLLNEDTAQEVFLVTAELLEMAPAAGVVQSCLDACVNVGQYWRLLFGLRCGLGGSAISSESLNRLTQAVTDIVQSDKHGLALQASRVLAHLQPFHGVMSAVQNNQQMLLEVLSKALSLLRHELGRDWTECALSDVELRSECELLHVIAKASDAFAGGRCIDLVVLTLWVQAPHGKHFDHHWEMKKRLKVLALLLGPAILRELMVMNLPGKHDGKGEVVEKERLLTQALRAATDLHAIDLLPCAEAQAIVSTILDSSFVVWRTDCHSAWAGILGSLHREALTKVSHIRHMICQTAGYWIKKTRTSNQAYNLAPCVHECLWALHEIMTKSSDSLTCSDKQGCLEIASALLDNEHYQKYDTLEWASDGFHAVGYAKKLRGLCIA